MNVLPLLNAGADSGSGSMIGLIIQMALLFGIMWFLLIRPQRKRQKETEAMQSAVKVGDPVLLDCGIYGKVVDIVNENLIVEMGMNKGIRVPVLRSRVGGVQEPDLSIVKEEEEEASEE